MLLVTLRPVVCRRRTYALCVHYIPISLAATSTDSGIPSPSTADSLATLPERAQTIPRRPLHARTSPELHDKRVGRDCHRTRQASRPDVDTPPDENAGFIFRVVPILSRQRENDAARNPAPARWRWMEGPCGA